MISVCERQGWDRYELATSGGEDFELLFTGPGNLAEFVDIPIYPIGKVVQGDELTWTLDNQKADQEFIGYRHF